MNSEKFYLKFIGHKGDLKRQMTEFFGFTFDKSDFLVHLIGILYFFCLVGIINADPAPLVLMNNRKPLHFEGTDDKCFRVLNG